MFVTFTGCFILGSQSSYLLQQTMDLINALKSPPIHFRVTAMMNYGNAHLCIYAQRKGLANQH